MEINGALQRTVVEAGDQALAQQRMLGKVTETDLLATDQQRSVSRRVQPSGIESLGYALSFYKHGFGRRVDDVIRARSMLSLEVEIANLRRVTDESSFQLFEMQMSRRYAFDRWRMSPY